MYWKSKEDFSNYIYKNYKHKNFLRKEINLIKIPTELVQFSQEVSELKFSDIYKFLYNNYITTIETTPSLGICILRQCIESDPYLYLVRQTLTLIEILFTIFSDEIYLDAIKNNIGPYVYCRFFISNRDKKKDKERGFVMNGRRAFSILKSKFQEYNVDIDEYSSETGILIKCDIKPPVIELGEDAKPNEVYENVHHLDLNSAFSSGIIDKYPELTPIYEDLYNNRHEKPEYKDVLNMSIGLMQSKLCDFKYALLSKAGVNYTVSTIRALAKKLKKAGRKVLLFNTDGIWYQGEIYTDSKCGNKLGQYKNDHINCTLRIKSPGSYEYIEDGTYTPVYRGISSYEKVKPREEFEWGDIFKGDIEEYFWIEGRGLVNNETRNI